MKSAPQTNNKGRFEQQQKVNKTIQGTLSRSLSSKIVTEMLKLSSEALGELQKVDRIDFDIFKLRDATNNNELVTVVMYLLSHNGLLNSSVLDFERLLAYINAVQRGYKNITYHNKTHAADLCQTFHYFCKAGLEQKAALDPTELVSLYVAACCHDYEHPGVNNVFLSNVKDPMAVRHNDISVLESHHIAASFKLMLSDERLNWMHLYDANDYKRMRKLMIDAVFSTDITKHFGDVA